MILPFVLSLIGFFGFFGFGTREAAFCLAASLSLNRLNVAIPITF
tara:strand:+ start:207 stop:341 length:135 start_codon:yes stop_codon:yes gene_type:complete